MPQNPDSARVWWLAWRRCLRTSFSYYQQFDSCEITGLDIFDDRGSEGGNLVAGIQNQAYAERSAIGRRNAVITVRSANHSYKSVLETTTTGTIHSFQVTMQCTDPKHLLISLPAARV